MASYILALDQGTTSSRAIVFDRAGQIAAKAQYPFPQTMVVSRWLVTPMPAMLPSGSPRMASAAARRSVSQMVMGSCSTQPACG